MTNLLKSKILLILSSYFKHPLQARLQGNGNTLDVNEAVLGVLGAADGLLGAVKTSELSSSPHEKRNAYQSTPPPTMLTGVHPRTAVAVSRLMGIPKSPKRSWTSACAMVVTPLQHTGEPEVLHWDGGLGNTSNQDKYTKGLGLLIRSGDRKSDEGGKSNKDFGEHCW